MQYEEIYNDGIGPSSGRNRGSSGANPGRHVAQIGKRISPANDQAGSSAAYTGGRSSVGSTMITPVILRPVKSYLMAKMN